MRILLEEDLSACNTLDEIQIQTQRTLGELQNEGFSIQYIAGPISCDGDEKIQRNLQLLVENRTRVMHALGERTLCFTAPFIFTPPVYDRLQLFSMERKEREARMQQFWDRLILSGVINGIHFTPGWERSPGACRERQTATAAGVPIADMATS